MKNILNTLKKGIILPLTFIGFSVLGQTVDKDSLRTQELKDLILLGDSLYSITYDMKQNVENSVKLDSLCEIYNAMKERFISRAGKVLQEGMKQIRREQLKYQQNLKNQGNALAKSEYYLYP